MWNPSWIDLPITSSTMIFVTNKWMQGCCCGQEYLVRSISCRESPLPRIASQKLDNSVGCPTRVCYWSHTLIWSFYPSYPAHITESTPGTACGPIFSSSLSGSSNEIDSDSRHATLRVDTLIDADGMHLPLPFRYYQPSLSIPTRVELSKFFVEIQSC